MVLISSSSPGEFPQLLESFHHSPTSLFPLKFPLYFYSLNNVIIVSSSSCNFTALTNTIIPFRLNNSGKFETSFLLAVHSLNVLTLSLTSSLLLP